MFRIDRAFFSLEWVPSVSSTLFMRSKGCRWMGIPNEPNLGHNPVGITYIVFLELFLTQIRKKTRTTAWPSFRRD